MFVGLDGLKGDLTGILWLRGPIRPRRRGEPPPHRRRDLRREVPGRRGARVPRPGAVHPRRFARPPRRRAGRDHAARERRAGLEARHGARRRRLRSGDDGPPPPLRAPALGRRVVLGPGHEHAVRSEPGRADPAHEPPLRGGDRRRLGPDVRHRAGRGPLPGRSRSAGARSSRARSGCGASSRTSSPPISAISPRTCSTRSRRTGRRSPPSCRARSRRAGTSARCGPRSRCAPTSTTRSSATRRTSSATPRRGPTSRTATGSRSRASASRAAGRRSSSRRAAATGWSSTAAGRSTSISSAPSSRASKRPTGTADVELSARGTRPNVEAVVGVKVDAELLRHSSAPLTFEDTVATLEIREHVIDVSACRAGSAAGRSPGRAASSARNWIPVRYNLEMAVDDAQVQWVETLPPAIGDGRFRFDGPVGALLLSGDVDVVGHDLLRPHRLGGLGRRVPRLDAGRRGHRVRRRADVQPRHRHRGGPHHPPAEQRRRGHGDRRPAGHRRHRPARARRHGDRRGRRPRLPPGPGVPRRPRRTCCSTIPWTWDPELDISLLTEIDSREQQYRVDYGVLGPFSDWRRSPAPIRRCRRPT